MKRSVLYGIFLSVLMLIINGCASKDEDLTNTKPTGTVPGEKVSGEGVQPGAGPGGASANVRF
jgi:hypothetical protein